MEGSNRYTGLKRLSVLMALDVAGSIAQIVRVRAVRVLSSGTLVPEEVLNAAGLYAHWFLRALRLLAWALTLVQLSRLAGLHRSFGRARRWYYLCILFSIAIYLTAGLTIYGTGRNGSEGIPLVLGVLFFEAVAQILSDTFLLPMGIRSVLRAGADLLDTFGLEDAAARNRRCGRRLARWTTVLLVLTLSTALLIAGAVLLRNGILFRPPDGDETTAAFLLLAGSASFLLAVPAGVGVMVLRFRAAGHMYRTYAVIEELTE